MQHHHTIIRNLIAEVRNLREQLADEQEYANTRIAKHQRTVADQREESARIARRAEEERRDHEAREWERERIQKEVEKRERWGDAWGADRERRKLRNL